VEDEESKQHSAPRNEKIWWGSATAARPWVNEGTHQQPPAFRMAPRAPRSQHRTAPPPLVSRCRCANPLSSQSGFPLLPLVSSILRGLKHVISQKCSSFHPGPWTSIVPSCARYTRLSLGKNRLGCQTFQTTMFTSMRDASKM